MMEYLIAMLVTVSVALLVGGVGALAIADSRGVRRRLVATTATSDAPARTREERRERIARALEEVGKRVRSSSKQRASVRTQLARAGYRNPDAVTAYFGLRAILMFGLGGVTGAATAALGLESGPIVYFVALMVALGWFLPRFYLKRRIRSRQKDLQKALADALDLLVVCVESGLGLNQALQRVSEEIAPVNQAMSDELNLVNLQIRAGASREEALRDLGERTGVSDIRAFTAMLVQTDRFGTSIARALRVHSDTLRTKRRQRAEEAAAKTTIKLVFPLVLFVFPAMFVVILAPAFIHFFEIMRNVG